jgi:hypothetical protein
MALVPHHPMAMYDTCIKKSYGHPPARHVISCHKRAITAAIYSKGILETGREVMEGHGKKAASPLLMPAIVADVG